MEEDLEKAPNRSQNAGVDSVIPGQTEDLQSIQEALGQTEAY